MELAQGGCRWRDIAVAVRGFEDYRAPLEAAFTHYGVPLFTARQTDITQKPLPALISAAYESILGGWERAELFAYLRTALPGLDAEECDELENYCITWDIKGGAWLSDRDWHMHPEGWQGEYDEAAQAALERINILRRRAAGPLRSLERACRAARTASEQARALADFFAELELAERLGGARGRAGGSGQAPGGGGVRPALGGGGLGAGAVRAGPGRDGARRGWLPAALSADPVSVRRRGHPGLAGHGVGGRHGQGCAGGT